MTAPTVTSAEIIERVTYLIEQLTPDIAATVAFERHADNTCKLHHVTDPARLRKIKVTLEAARISGWASKAGSSTNLGQTLRVRIGYPAEDTETIDGTDYSVEDLKVGDLEQIRRLLDGTPFALDGALPALPGVKLTRFEGTSDEYNGTVRSILYTLAYGRA
jgi:hypothetical protein